MINVGIVGLGRMGRLHMMNCLQIDNVKVVAAADPSKKALNIAKSAGVNNFYTDYHELLNHSSKVDAIVISLPNFLHFESIQLALEAGLNVFTEKPMASSVEECHEIAKLVKKCGQKFMIGHNLRFVNGIERMKDELEKGYIGTLEAVTIEEIMNGPFAHSAVPAPVSDWWFDPKKSGGGVLLDLGYHVIDLFRFFVGESEVIFSCLDHKFNLSVEDEAIVILRSMDSLTKGIINVGWYQKNIFPKYNFRVILHGNAGYFFSGDFVPHNLYLHAIKEGTKNLLRRIVRKRIRPLSYTYYYESYYKELVHFFDSIMHDSDPLVSAIDGLKAVELIKEAYEKSHENQLSKV